MHVGRFAVYWLVSAVFAVGLVAIAAPRKALASGPCVVTASTDTGLPGELRGMITTANGGGCTANTITFAILPLSTVHTITLGAGTPLPNITQPVTIDASTEDVPGIICNPSVLPAGGPHPEIVIDANAIGSLNAALWLDNGSSGSVIKGLAITKAPGPGIFATTSNDTIVCNYIGLAADGTTAAGNGSNGVFFSKSGANPSPSNNTIGGITPADRNVISSNIGNELVITDVGSSNNVIEGNYFSTDALGTAARPDGGIFPAVLLVSGASNNTVGGTVPGARNLISGNAPGVGVQIDGAGSQNNVIEGNYIGTDVNGTAALPNNEGILISSSATNNVVGGTVPGARNLISGNPFGVQIDSAGSQNNVIEGNYIGTDVTGTAALPNVLGVLISAGATNNVVGGTVPGARNLISGNTVGAGFGVQIDGAGSQNNVIEGNYIGTDVNGTAALPNSRGVFISAGASNNTVGGTVPGARNLISGNTGGFGVEINGVGCQNNVVEGNYIGTDVTGTATLPNSLGVLIRGSATNNVVGGTASGARNLISGNTSGYGVEIDGAGTQNNIIEGNYIGTDVTGTLSVPNIYGIAINPGATNNVVGGTVSGTRNIISGNTLNGINISGVGTSGNLVEGNYFGTDVTGTLPLGNTDSDVTFSLGATNNQIGGTTAAQRNVMADSKTAAGVRLRDPGTNNNLVEGNYIGLNAAGTSALGNANHGVEIILGAQSNTVGGTAAGAGNVISGNTSDGVIINGAGNNSNSILGNLIGTLPDGTSAMPNSGFGVSIVLGAQNNIIGGTAAGAGNVIAFNTKAGVGVADPTSTGNAIRGNQIYSNSVLGIDLNEDSLVTPNDPGDADTGPNNLQNFPIITAATAAGTNYVISGTLNSTASTGPYQLDFYSSPACDTSGNGQGKSYLGSTTVTTDGGGNATFTNISVPAVSGEQTITSTATNPGGDTSEFSSCMLGPVIVLPTSTLAPPGSSSSPSNTVNLPDALQLQILSSNSLVVRPGDTYTLTASITNTTSSPISNISFRVRIDDPFDVTNASSTVGTAQINCQLITLTIASLAPGQQATITVQAQLSAAADPTNNEASNVLAVEYRGGKLKTAGNKVGVMRNGRLPSTGYPPPDTPSLPSGFVTLLVGLLLGGGILVGKRLLQKVKST